MGSRLLLEALMGEVSRNVIRKGNGYPWQKSHIIYINFHSSKFFICKPWKKETLLLSISMEVPSEKWKACLKNRKKDVGNLTKMSEICERTCLAVLALLDHVPWSSVMLRNKAVHPQEVFLQSVFTQLEQGQRRESGGPECFV